MAKKSADGFNMASEIRSLLSDDKTLGAAACLEALQKKHPKRKFKKGSFSVAFYGARNSLGIKSGKRRKKKAAGTKKVVRKPSAASVDLSTLQAAAKFVAQVGDADTALEAIRQVRSLQIG